MQLVYLSPVPWHSFSQRPHELIHFFHSETGGKVLWVDPYPTRFPTLADFGRQRAKISGPDLPLAPWMEVLKPVALPVEPMPFSGFINSRVWKSTIEKIEDFCDPSTVIGIGKPSELAYQVITRCSNAYTFYDAMDDFPAFYDGQAHASMVRRQHQIASLVDRILVSSTKLKHDFDRFAHKTKVVLNACASDRLPAIKDQPLIRKSPFPTFGYIGTIAKWFDWDMVKAFAYAYPEGKIRIIGPQHIKVPRSLTGNIVIEPPVVHGEALQLMQEFDIGLIPFKNTRLTSAVDPIKYYEYRASGLPVISTAFGEMEFRGKAEHTFLIRTAKDILDAVDSCIVMQPTEIETENFRRENSWSIRFKASEIFSL